MLASNQAAKSPMTYGLDPVETNVAGLTVTPLLGVVVPEIEPFTRIGVEVLLLVVPDETSTVTDPDALPLRSVTV